jgi:hypothetical protein
MCCIEDSDVLDGWEGQPLAFLQPAPAQELQLAALMSILGGTVAVHEVCHTRQPT